MIKKYEVESDGKININLTCEKCGGPIVNCDDLGFRCEKNCYLKENLEASKQLKEIHQALCNIFKD